MINQGLLKRIKVARYTLLQLFKDRINKKNRIFEENFIRASGNCICEICNGQYYDHLYDTEYDFLNIRCDGQRLKL